MLLLIYTQLKNSGRKAPLYLVILTELASLLQEIREYDLKP